MSKFVEANMNLRERPAQYQEEYFDHKETNKN